MLEMSPIVQALHLYRIQFQLVHGLNGLPAVAHEAAGLAGDNLRGLPGTAREADHQRGFQLAADGIGHSHRIDDHPVVTQELYEIDAAEGSRVLILPATG